MLWNNHPSIQFNKYPCSTNGKPSFQNQCAIKIGICLEQSGISTRTFNGARCYPGHGHQQKHILRAEELAKWIEKQRFQFGKVIKSRSVTKRDYLNKKGILFFKNFWGVNNQGDHIDLWNGKELPVSINQPFSRSKEVWFWELH